MSQGYMDILAKYNVDSTHINLNSKTSVSSNSGNVNTGILSMKKYKQLIKFECVGCGLNKIKDVPESLIVFVCADNNIVNLPSKIPDNLEILSCYSNRIKEFPPN